MDRLQVMALFFVRGFRAESLKAETQKGNEEVMYEYEGVSEGRGKGQGQNEGILR